jgi:hypothetical protein
MPKYLSLQNRRISCLSLHRIFDRGVFLLLLVAFALTITSCDREDFIDSSNARVEFSVDTLRFDTVFTERGTVTRFFKVYNPHDQAIRVQNARMEQQETFFRFNFDGFGGNQVEEVIIWPKDSTYVFVEATIDPDQDISSSPFVITERMLFEVNGNTQHVTLEAFGQNANYIPARDATGGIVQLICGGGTVVWDDPRPYVIFGVLVIDDCTLVWPAGARIHIHGGIATDGQIIYNDGLIFTGQKGRILSEGTAGNPVVVEGDRLEPGFADIAGQWSGIRLGATSGPHKFTHTTIKNSIIGIRSDSATSVELNNVRILNTTGPGLVGIHNQISATNCLIANNGGHSVQLSYGGNHQFTYTTLGNYGNQLEALRMDNFFCYDPPDCDNIGLNPLSVSFTNSIVGGNGRDEIRIIDVTNREPGFMNFSFDHCLVRVFDLLREQSYPDFMEDCNNCINYDLFEPLFVNLSDGNYRLDSLSIARGQARPLPGITLDIVENPRDTENPDIGCFEWVGN